MQPSLRQVPTTVQHFIRHPSAAQLLFQWFAGLILLGTILLSLPFSHAGGSVSVLDALFTSTSAVCVTGLSTIDTGTRFSLAGQWIILVLLQLGGLGILTFLALAFRALGRRMDLQSQAVVEDSLYQTSAARQFRENFLRIIRVVLLIEALGALLLFLAMLPGHAVGHSLYSAIFHAIASFTHAGFSLYSDSLEGFRGNPVFLATVMLLIFFGSLGLAVLGELASVAMRWRELLRSRTGLPWFSLHARIVLKLSVALVLVGTLLILAGGGLSGSPAQQVQDALFQSVSARSGGLATVNIGTLPLFSILVLVILMFIGGSPGSCAGGIKTTTLALWWARFSAAFRGRVKPVLGGRSISEDLSRRVTMLIGLAVCWNLLGLLVLSLTERAPLSQLLFEQVSAFGTVGLSTGLTPELSVAGKLWVILNMFLGRLGPITVAMSTVKLSKGDIGYPEGRVMIG